MGEVRRLVVEMITRTHNAYHLGDNLVHLHFMRKIALVNPDREFMHYAQWQYIRQLSDLVSDVPNLNLSDYGYMLPSDSINAWRGDKGFWYSHPDRNDFVKFHLEAWFPYLCERMEVENPMRTATDMLFDYPAIQKAECNSNEFDVLFINSPPGSGQFSGYNEFELAELAKKIHDKGFCVIVTHPMPDNGAVAPQYYPQLVSTKGKTVTEIGHLSLHCHTILMVSTGPSWPTFNIWNKDSIKNRIILLDEERLYLAPNTIHCQRIEEAAEVLKESGLL